MTLVARPEIVEVGDVPGTCMGPSIARTMYLHGTYRMLSQAQEVDG
jgi:hypothetical protein